MSVLGCFFACVRLHHDGAFIASLLAAVASASARRNPFSSHAALNVDGPENASTESGEHFVACHMTGSSAANGRRAISFHDHHVFMASARNCVSASAGAIGAGTTVRRCDGDERDFFTGMLAAFFTRTLADFLAAIRAKIVESGQTSASTTTSCFDVCAKHRSILPVSSPRFHLPTPLPFALTWKIHARGFAKP